MSINLMVKSSQATCELKGQVGSLADELAATWRWLTFTQRTPSYVLFALSILTNIA